MKAALYSFKSKSVGYYNPPFLATCDAEAKYRVAQAAISAEGDSFEKDAEGFCLCKLGSFDPATGLIEPCDVVVCEFSEVINSLEAYRKAGD